MRSCIRFRFAELPFARGFLDTVFCALHLLFQEPDEAVEIVDRVVGIVGGVVSHNLKIHDYRFRAIFTERYSALIRVVPLISVAAQLDEM